VASSILTRFLLFEHLSYVKVGAAVTPKLWNMCATKPRKYDPVLQIVGGDETCISVVNSVHSGLPQFIPKRQ